MTIESARADLAAALVHTGLTRIDDYERDTVNPPCLIIGNPLGTYDDDFDGDLTVTFPVTLLVGRQDAARASETIEPYIEATGSKSVPAAIKAHMASGRVVGFSNYGGGYTVGGGETEYAGVTFEVQALID